MKLKGLNALGNDCYFIRLTDNKDYYIHLKSEDNKNYEYVVEKGINGACGWHKKEGEEWIKTTGANNLELIEAIKVLKNDGTLN